MEDVSEPASILVAKIARKRLGESVTDGVRMTETFALDHLDDVIVDLKRR
jgi:hypothetical protein